MQTSESPATSGSGCWWPTVACIHYHLISTWPLSRPPRVEAGAQHPHLLRISASPSPHPCDLHASCHNVKGIHSKSSCRYDACLRVRDVGSERQPVDHTACSYPKHGGQEKLCLETIAKSQWVFICDTLIIYTGTLEVAQLFEWRSKGSLNIIVSPNFLFSFFAKVEESLVCLFASTYFLFLRQWPANYNVTQADLKVTVITLPGSISE